MNKLRVPICSCLAIIAGTSCNMSYSMSELDPELDHLFGNISEVLPNEKNKTLWDILPIDIQNVVSIQEYFIQALEQNYSASNWFNNLKQNINNIIKRIKDGVPKIALDDIRNINECIQSVLMIPDNEYKENNILISKQTPAQQETISLMANDLVDILQEIITLYNKSQAQANKISYEPGKKFNPFG